MKVRKHSWILIPLAAVLGLLLGRSGYVERALNPLPRIATAVNSLWGWVSDAAYRSNESGTIRDYIATQEYLKSHTVRKLQLGAGGNDPERWLNSDIAPSPKEIYLDATRPYPFPDGSFQYVFSEHVI